MIEPIIEKSVYMDGVQKLYRFENGFGASVVRHEFSYGSKSGLWEMAIIKYTGPKNDDWSITYTTGLTSDVIGYLSDNDVQDWLKKVKGLEPDTYVECYNKEDNDEDC